MEMQDMMTVVPAELPQQIAQMPPDVAAAFARMAEATAAMMRMMQATNERMSRMEKEIRLLTKVTPAQASQINGAIRMRAAELCKIYRIVGQEKPVASAIRRAVKLSTGAGSVREIPRCEYQVVLGQVNMWDDYDAMMAIRRKGSG